MLAPIVRRMAWGRARCERMELEHQQQRHRLDAFEVAIADASLFPELAAIEASALVAELREHMDFEERDLLSSELLRDDAVVIEQTNR